MLYWVYAAIKVITVTGMSYTLWSVERLGALLGICDYQGYNCDWNVLHSVERFEVWCFIGYMHLYTR